MIRFRGGDLRIPTLQLRGEHQTPVAKSWDFMYLKMLAGCGAAW